MKNLVHKGRENGGDCDDDFNENMYRYRKYTNKRWNKHIGVGSQPCYSWNGTGTASSSGPGRSWIAGPAEISRLGPNSELHGNNRSFPETRECDRVPVKKIGSRDSIFGLVNSTYSFEITNHNQLVSNIKYLANFIKKYWTYFRYQKLADFLVCLPPSVRV